MKKPTPVPHDAAFKAFLTHPDTARDFIELHLPAELRAACDLSTLKLESGSFVEESLRAYYSDVLYSLKTSAGDGYIHVLIEHQSTPDRHMAFRLMRYAVAAMQRHLDAGHKCQQRVKSDPLTVTTNGLILIHLVYSGLASAITPAFRFCFSR